MGHLFIFLRPEAVNVLLLLYGCACALSGSPVPGAPDTHVSKTFFQHKRVSVFRAKQEVKAVRPDNKSWRNTSKVGREMEMVCESGTCRPYRSAGDAGHLWVLCLRDRGKRCPGKEGGRRGPARGSASTCGSSELRWSEIWKKVDGVAKPGVFAF